MLPVTFDLSTAALAVDSARDMMFLAVSFTALVSRHSDATSSVSEVSTRVSASSLSKRISASLPASRLPSTG